MLVCRTERWVAEGVELIQLREKRMGGGDLLALAEDLVRIAEGTATRILVNGRADVAAAAGAQGVHLTATPDELRPEQVRTVFSEAGKGRPVVSVSCHTVAEVERAAAAGADFLLFGPIFEKRVDDQVVGEGAGFARLCEACFAARGTPVLALGGVTQENAPACLRAGAAGVAGIRLFA